MFGRKKNHHFVSFLPVFVIPILVLIVIQIGCIHDPDYFFFFNSDTARATTNNRHTMKLKDAAVGSAIQIGGKTFIKIADNQYMQKAPVCHTRVWDFDYTGSEQTFIAPADGTYKLEVWGAQGGCVGAGINSASYGGYSTGNIELNKNSRLYVIIGGKGHNHTLTFDQAVGGYNGGGLGGKGSSNVYNNTYIGGGGGGATHIATKNGLLSTLSSNQSSVLIVAGGGGGSGYGPYYDYGGGSGGGTIGNSGGYHFDYPTYHGTGGTQTEGGIDQSGESSVIAGTFGQGSDFNGIYGGSGGGGGWYGGGGTNRQHCGAGGGSGYIGNSLLSDKHMTCYNCTTSNEEATRTQSNTCISPNPAADCAKIGHGHARIILLTANEEDCYTPECPAGTAYSAKYGDCKPLASFTEVAQVTDFVYTGNAQSFTTSTSGVYKIELWGASGTNRNDIGGVAESPGGYTKGIIVVDNVETFYTYVGEHNSTISGACDSIAAAFNGSTGFTCSNGGGATDIRLASGNVWHNENSLRSRIMVAGGGGGTYYAYSSQGGFGGGLNGYSGIGAGSAYYNGTPKAGTAGAGGTQVSGFSFGAGGESTSNGGGGWYGGAGGWAANAGGGSSYISGHTGCVAVTSLNDTTPKAGCTTGTSDRSCSLSPTGYSFTNTVMIDGAGYAWTNTKGSLQAMPNPAGGYYASGVGHTGNGFARITRLEVPANDCGLHATLTGTNTCTCANGYYADANGSTTTGMGGSCLYQKCGNNTTSEYGIACTCATGYYADNTGSTAPTNAGACNFQKYCTGDYVTNVFATSAPSSCTCKSGYYGNSDGTTSTTTTSGSCVACAANTAYNSTAKRCIATTMQAFTTAMCNAFATPTGSNYTTVGSLKDTRNNVSYTIRKFGDGHCWMVDNLRYGICVDASTWAANDKKSLSGVLGSGLYGQCLADSAHPEYGYYYTWQAAIQHVNGNVGVSYQPTEPTQGLCPTGWYLPPYSGEYSLANPVSKTDDNSNRLGGYSPNFVTNFNTVYAGGAMYDGSFYGQGSSASWWSSTQAATNAIYFWVKDNQVNAFNDDKDLGLSIRCVKQ